MTIRFDAKDAVNYLTQEKQIIRLAKYDGEKCIGRGRALIVSGVDGVAVMLQDCGTPDRTGIRAGNLVNYVLHPELTDENGKIVGTPAIG